MCKQITISQHIENRPRNEKKKCLDQKSEIRIFISNRPSNTPRRAIYIQTTTTYVDMRRESEVEMARDSFSATLFIINFYRNICERRR